MRVLLLMMMMMIMMVLQIKKENAREGQGLFWIYVECVTSYPL
jgi:hypothetical protein